MNQEEALAYLGLKSGSDLLEKKNEILFESKRFFATQPVVKEVFNRRIERIVKQQEAFDVVICFPEEVAVPEKFELICGTSLIDQFNTFQKVKNTIKTSIYNAKGFNELKAHATELVDIYDQFTVLWDCSIEMEEAVLIGKESDPMEILHELKFLVGRGIETIEQLNKDTALCPPILKKELLRMKLLKERNEQRRYISQP